MRSLVTSIFLICVVAGIHSPQVASAQSTDDSEHGKGLIPDPPEKLKLVPVGPTYRGDLARETVDLTRYFPDPGYQGQQGSCVGWAVGYAARAYYAVAREGALRNDRSRIPSPAFIYNSIKKPGSCETGSSIYDALVLLRDSGSMSYDEYPYDEDSCDRPSLEETRRADGFRIDGFYRFDPEEKIVDNIKGALASDKPVILSLKTTRAFDRLKPGEIYSRPTECISKDGNCNHAITVVGYDDRIQAFKLINSWGTRKWGSEGFGWIAYDTLKTELNQAYVMNPPPPPPICSLRSDTPAITRGESATIYFRTERATSVEFDNGLGADSTLGSQSSEGTRIVSPLRTTTYSAIVRGRGGKATCSVRITVQEPKPIPIPPVITSFTTKPETILPGQSAKLTWTVSGATSLQIEPNVGPLTGGGIIVRPRETTSYTLIASNAAGSTRSTATVTVNVPKSVDLPDLDCGKVSLEDRAGKRTIVGFVKSKEFIDKIRNAVPDIPIDVKVRPFPQCEALITLSKALSAGDRPKLSIRKKADGSLSEREPLVFEIQTPSYPSYVSVSYIQADGFVRHLIQPGEGGNLVVQAPSSKIVIGDGSDGGKKFFVTAPFGEELVIVTAGRSPLFPEPRPKLETEREFLSALRRALIYKPNPSAPDREIVAAIDAVVTRAGEKK